MASDGSPEPPLEAPPRPRPPAGEDDFEQVERLTRAVVAFAARAALVGLPIWLTLLLFFPLVLGLGVLASFTLASLIAIGAVVAVGRWLRRRGEADARGATTPAGRSPRVQIGPLGAVLATLAAVAALAWTIFVLVSA